MVFVGINAFSQSLPNNDLEDWTSFLLYDEPADWSTPNLYTFLAEQIVSVSKSNDAYSGNYSARLESISVLDGQIVVPGLITLADFSISLQDSNFSISGGYFLQQNVYQLTGRYKYTGVDDDSATVFMYSYTNDMEMGFDTIGVGYKVLGNTNEWTSFTVPMENLKNSIPDTFNVLIASSSITDVKAGSVLLIDSISIYTNTGILDLWSPKTPLKVFPNPAVDFVNFVMEKPQNASVLTIYDNFGRKINQKEFFDLSLKINIQDFNPGIYTYTLSKGNKILNSGTFLKH